MRRTPRPADGRMSLVEHIHELRRRMMWALLAVAVGVGVTFVFWEPVFSVLRRPYCDIHPPHGCQLYAYGIFDQFNTKMRVALIGGTVLSSPVWLYQLGAFITPALHKRERRYAAGFLAGALVLFVAGVLAAYAGLPFGLRVLTNAAGHNVQQLLSLRDYLSFVTLLLVITGLSFQFPVVLVFLNLTGVLSFERMRAWRRAMWFCLFAAAAILTPSTDPFQFIALGVPLCLLYELCVLIARLRARAQRKRREHDPIAQLPDDVPSQVDPEPSPLA